MCCVSHINVCHIGWKNAQLAHQLQERERRIKDHLDIAAKGEKVFRERELEWVRVFMHVSVIFICIIPFLGPLRQTFTHNPLKQTSAPMSTENSPRPKQVQQKGGKKRPWEETIGWKTSYQIVFTYICIYLFRRGNNEREVTLNINSLKRTDSVITDCWLFFGFFFFFTVKVIQKFEPRHNWKFFYLKSIVHKYSLDKCEALIQIMFSCKHYLHMFT